MTLTKKRQDEILKAGYMPPGVTTLVRVMLPVLRVLARIGFVRRSIKRTVGGRFGDIFRCQKRGDHEKAVDLAIDALRAFRGRKPGRYDFGHLHLNWWTFMRSATVSLQKLDDPESWEAVIALARDGMEPFEGFDVAYAFHIFARKKLAERDYETAVEFATLSASADETWAESDLLLGWYEQKIGGGDAFGHLRRAVRKDQSVLFRIADDPAFQQPPDLVARLKETSKYGLVQ